MFPHNTSNAFLTKKLLTMTLCPSQYFTLGGTQGQLVPSLVMLTVVRVVSTRFLHCGVTISLFVITIIWGQVLGYCVNVLFLVKLELNSCASILIIIFGIWIILMIVAKWHNFFIYSALKEAITSRYHLDPKYITNILVRFFFFFFEADGL